jgi:hypothetical protein
MNDSLQIDSRRIVAGKSSHALHAGQIGIAPAANQPEFPF